MNALSFTDVVAAPQKSLTLDVFPNVQLTTNYDAIIEGWLRALKLRDAKSEQHARRVADLTVQFGRSIGLREQDLVYLKQGALLHDIGKLIVPYSVLLKPERLSYNEEQIMRSHPVYAYEMLSPISFPRMVVDIALYHHEKWNGEGYPFGLAGEDIPYAARMVAIADVWDALTTERNYRTAWSKGEAIAYFHEKSGVHFDADLVDLFLRTV